MAANLDLLDVRLYEIAANTRAQAEREYSLSADHQLCIILLDLVASTNHRFFRGPKEAFERATVFYQLCHGIFDHSRTIQIAKKMGDGILAFGTDITEVIEGCLLIMRAERLVRNEFADELFPFQVRIGISQGSLKRISSDGEDYLGSAIDELSKIMGVIKPLPDNSILISRSFLKHHTQTLQGYKCVTVGKLQSWTDSSGPPTHTPIDFYLAEVDSSEMSVCTESYVLWSKQLSLDQA